MHSKWARVDGILEGIEWLELSKVSRLWNNGQWSPLICTLVSLGKLEIQPPIVPSCNLIILGEVWALRFLKDSNVTEIGNYV